MKKNKYFMIILVFLTLIICFMYPMKVLAWGDLKEKIQKELDNNIFLQKERIKLRVIEEKNGYVFIEMYEGNRKIREGINKGIDIQTPQFEQKWASDGSSESEKKALNALRRTISHVKTIDGVKEVQMTSKVNTQLDRAEDLNIEAAKLVKQKKEDEAIKLYKEAANMGDRHAQYNLAQRYYKGIVFDQNFAEAAKWFRKSADQDFDRAQWMLGRMYWSGEGVEKSYKDAESWLIKAVDQGYSTAQNSLAWFYSTCPDSKFLNPQKALEYSLLVNSKDPDKWYNVGTLAAAYARNGQFDKAVPFQKESISLLEKEKDISIDNRKDILEKAYYRLSLYRKGEPYQESDKPISESKILETPEKNTPTEVKSEVDRTKTSLKSKTSMPPNGISLVDRYRAEIAAIIQNKWVYSSRTKAQKNLKVCLIFKVLPDGEIKDIRFTEKTGNDEFDNSAYEAIFRSSPVKPHPNGVKDPYVSVAIRFTPN
jgi:TonB family protein